MRTSNYGIYKQWLENLPNFEEPQQCLKCDGTGQFEELCCHCDNYYLIECKHCKGEKVTTKPYYTYSQYKKKIKNEHNKLTAWNQSSKSIY